MSGNRTNLVEQWYDPRQGRFVEPPRHVRPGPLRLRAPDTNDWTVLIHAPADE